MRTSYQEFLAQVKEEMRRELSFEIEDELVRFDEFFRSLEFHVKMSNIHFRAAVYAREEKDWQQASPIVRWYLRYWQLMYWHYFRSECRITLCICLGFVAVLSAFAGYYLGKTLCFWQCLDPRGAIWCAFGVVPLICGIAGAVAASRHFYRRYVSLGAIVERYTPEVMTGMARLDEDERARLMAILYTMSH